MNRLFLPCILQLMSLYAGLGKLRKRGGIHRIRRLREQRGAFFTLLPELKKDPAEFKKFTRMSLAAFEKLLEMVRSSLKKMSFRAWICPAQRLLVTLRYLATGNSFTSLAFTFFLGETTALMRLRSRGIRASDQYRTEDLVGEVRKHRVLWSREAREFHSTAARSMAYKRVADAMNAAFRTFDRGTAKKCVITGAC
ncbi:nuclease HARBI1-like protein [Aphelenchoides avenae]|nr:nuclease HARBI1-like protein [Aphelenchus avenae]